MSENINKQIKQHAKTLKDWENECKQLVPENALKISNKSNKWIPYDTFHLTEMIPVDVVLKILERHETTNAVVIEQLNEVIREYEQKLQELADMLKTRPRNCKYPYALEKWIEGYEKKFVELGVKSTKELNQK